MLLPTCCCRYNEPQLLKEVEARLSAPIISLNEDITLPADMQVCFDLLLMPAARDAVWAVPMPNG
jgi:hypothetical protein